MDIAKARVLLAHSDPHEEARLRQALRPCRRVDACRDYPGLVRAMNERAYDLLIMPVAVCGADAETVRAEICARREISCPAMIVLLPNGLARAMRSFYNEGVVCLEGAPVGEKRLLETLGGLSEDDRLLPDWAGEEKVRAVLDRLSIPRTLKGYDLLLRASRLLAKNGLLIGRLKTDVYPACGEGSGDDTRANNPYNTTTGSTAVALAENASVVLRNRSTGTLTLTPLSGQGGAQYTNSMTVVRVG